MLEQEAQLSMPATNPRYSMRICWSDEDGAFLVPLPELYGEGRFCTHGETYEEAAKNGREVMELLIEDHRESGQPLSAPSVVRHDDAGSCLAP